METDFELATFRLQVKLPAHDVGLEASAVVLDGGPGSCGDTHIEAVVGHVGGHRHVVVAHGLVDVLIVFHQHTLGPHVLHRPSVSHRAQSTG